jgi:glutamyl-tRNA synthetase
LFNWLFARRHDGVFILRIEDTDVERSSSEMIDGILDGLRWLGLDWDEGPDINGPHAPYFQSERLQAYRLMAADLVRNRRAYYCYCTPDELKTRRAAAETRGIGWRYDRACLSLDGDTVAAFEDEGRQRAVRFLVPPGTSRFDDLVHGPIAFDNANIEDFVILRSDGHPTYHLSVVADDVAMEITHIVRGDDHISNTPKHVLLYEALGVRVPQFAHVPLILGADKKRLSKRHGATSVMDYARRGYLPEAMLNFLSLLGWSPGPGDRELFTAVELKQVFDLRGISGGNAVFNSEKLDWFNQQYIMRLPPDELLTRVRPFFEEAGLWRDEYLADRRAWFSGVLDLLKVRAKRLDEFVPLGCFFFTDEVEYDEKAVAKYLTGTDIAEHLQAVVAAFAALDSPLDPVSVEEATRSVADARGVKAATLIHALRVALTGKTVSPGLFEVAALLGRQRVERRLVRAAAQAAEAR